MNILVTGGAGYIGTHTLIELLSNGHSVVVVDNLSNSSQESLRRVEKITDSTVPFYQLDLRDSDGLESVFSTHQFDAAVHFAGLKSVGQSVSHPLEYYSNNIDSTLMLLTKMQQHGVKKLVFSSSATVYGEPEELPLKETSRVGIGITNPYGQTKFMIEQMLRDVSTSDPSMEITLLRYFNPVGAHSSGLIGEDPNDIPNNLLPYVSQVAVGKLQQVSVYGDDYNTIDGTGVRDYIHVVDLARGHVAALNHSKAGIDVITYVRVLGRRSYNLSPLSRKHPAKIFRTRSSRVAPAMSPAAMQALLKQTSSSAGLLWKISSKPVKTRGAGNQAILTGTATRSD